MKILLVTNMYPTECTPYYGIFVKEQEEAITNEYADVEYDVEFIDARKNKFAYVSSFFRIAKKINRGQYDLIHVHYGFSGLFLLNPLLKKIPVILTLHGGDIQSEQGKQFQVFFTRQILKKVDVAITLNERMDSMAKKYAKETHIIPCSVDTNFFTPPLKKEIDSEEKRIIFPSDKERFVKNYPLFERSVKILEKKYNIKCHVSEIKNMSRREVADLYQSSDLMIMTSISEGSPQVVKEAMSCNLPVVSTNVGDVSILLKGVKGSYVAKEMDADLIADLAYKSLFEQAGNGVSGREKIFALGIDNNSVARNIYKIYKGLVRCID